MNDIQRQMLRRFGSFATSRRGFANDATRIELLERVEHSASKEQLITQSLIKSSLDYDPITGAFTWRIRPSNNTRAGQSAGTINQHGYLHIRLGGFGYQAHRLAWLYIHGKLPDSQIDHINGQRADNRLVNLREATHGDNMRNIARNKRNTSGYRGVSYVKESGKWESRTKFNNKTYYFGHFDTAEEASRVYLAFIAEHHGEFSHVRSRGLK